MLLIKARKLRDPKEAVEALRAVHRALLKAALRENNLRAYIAAQLAVLSLNHCIGVMHDLFSSEEPCFYLAEPSDEIRDLLRECVAQSTSRYGHLTTGPLQLFE